MKNNFLIILLVFLLFALPASAADYFMATSDIEVHTAPDSASAVAFKLKYGEDVEVLGNEEGWYQISYQGQKGYAPSSYFSPVERAITKDSFSIGSNLGIIVVFIVWLLPIISISVSNVTSGNEKTAWILAVIFVSWFAWIFYILLAPLKSKQE